MAFTPAHMTTPQPDPQTVDTDQDKDERGYDTTIYSKSQIDFWSRLPPPRKRTRSETRPCEPETSKLNPPTNQPTLTDITKKVCLQKFPKWTAANIETEGVMIITSEKYPYVFVQDDHPVIYTLKQNEHLLNKPIQEFPKCGGHWYRMHKQVFDKAISALRDSLPTIYGLHTPAAS